MDTLRGAIRRLLTSCACGFLPHVRAAVALCAVSCCTATCIGEDRGLRLRVVVRHEASRAWSGRLSLTGGQFTDLRRLDPTTAVSRPLIVNQQTVSFQRQGSQDEAAFDVTATTDLASAIALELSGSTLAAPTTIRVPLIDLVNGSFEQTIPGTQFAVRMARAPGDSLRVRFARQHLVFAPGESCLMDVVPHLASIETGAVAKLEVRLHAARNRKVLWRHQQSIAPDDNGNLRPLERLEVPVPKTEGAYDLTFTLSRDGLRNLLKANEPTAERTVQFAVVSPVPATTTEDGEWREVLEYDTSQPQWWERLTRFPAWEGLPGSFRQLFGENFGEPLFRQGRHLNRIEGDGWLALPLPVLHQGRVHRLEIEYPTDAEQTMAVTLIERDPTSTALTASLQTGFHVDPNQADLSKGTQTMVFWPRSRFGYVVLSNKNSTKPIEFGRVRIVEGPTEIARPVENAVGTRRSFAHFSDANLTRVFSGSLAVDPVLQRPLTDWQTFLETGQHLVQYLHHAGLSGAALPLTGHHGALVPSSLMDDGTSVDSGPLFSAGQDALPKDVLELYFRLFDRENLQLVPTLRFDQLVSELEVARFQAESAVGIQLVAADGTAATNATTARYNVLDARVQQTIQKIVQRVVQRYAHHDSFAGVAIELDGQSFACLPGWVWGYDSTTVQRFLQQAAAAAPTAADATQINDLVSGDLATAWQRWRIGQVTQLYQRLAADVRHRRPDSTLYLLSAGLIGAPEVRQSLIAQQSPRDALATQLAAMGLDPAQLNQVPGLEMVRPNVNALGRSLIEQRPEVEASSSLVMSQVFPSEATQVVNVALRVELPKIKDLRSQERPVPTTSILSEIQPTSSSQLRQLAASLVEHDVRTVFLSQREPLGNLDTISNWSSVFRRLPSEPFATLAPTSGPLVVRQLVRGQETLIYVVNRSPWATQSAIALRLPSNTRLDSVDPTQRNDIRLESDVWVWRTELPPFGLAATVTSTPQVELVSIDHQLPSVVPGLMQAKIAALANRASLIGEPRSWNVLSNANFDQPPIPREIPGWQASVDRGVSSSTCVVDAAVSRSGAALRMEGKGEVTTVRSDTFAAPDTGRLSMHMWLRRSPNAVQPDLRFALEGQLDGRPYYRFASVGPTDDGQPEWAPFVLHIDDLPDEGLTNLRVRFDLIGQGTVWLDDVELYDLSFTRAEQHETSKLIALADLQLREGRMTDCWHTLDRYWPRYILTYVAAPTPEVASVPQLADPPISEVKPKETESPFQRMRDLIPQWPRK